jgi:DNA processing protein
MNEQNLHLLRLLLSADIGSARFSRLIEKFGDAQSILKANKYDLMSVEGIGETIANSIVNPLNSSIAEKELQNAEKHNIKILLFNDENYPKSLQSFTDKPLLLYMKGKILKKDFDSISIVGSRKLTNYGRTVTSDFASYFAKKNVTVISGLARGVDTIAHISALENNCRTIAILGNGLLVNYPPENTKLQEKIAQCGAVISEFPLTTHPDKSTFPRRNRLVAGFSRATLLTEAALTSGALITAKFCAEYGKDIFAIPGSIYSKTSQGTNMLIQNGAIPVLSPYDLEKHLNWMPKNENETSNTKTLANINAFEKKILNLIEEDSCGLPPDIIAQKLDAQITEVSSALFNLEINGLIKSTAGQAYIRAY